MIRSLCLVFFCLAVSARLYGAEEFVGPLPGWKNLRTDYGAKGDGRADDTAALEAGLAGLPANGQSSRAGDSYVLYLPAGEYRITRPLVLENRMAISILGENPARTKIIYDGPRGEVMLTLHGVSYSKFGRITWDGRGKARAAVAHQWNPVTRLGPPGTFLEHADEIFQDVGRGIIGGYPAPLVDAAGKVTGYQHGMDAECMVKRCQFVRCAEAGLSIESFNALDWWLWDCAFEDCGVAATNCAEGEYGGGHFHIYRSFFRGSKIADIRLGHTSYFGFRFNTSIGPRRFLETTRPPGYQGFAAWKDEDIAGSQIALQGNRIIHPLDPTPIWVNQNAVITLLDNTFVVKKTDDAPVVKMVPPTGEAHLISIGNRFHGASQVEMKGKPVSIDNAVLEEAGADVSLPGLPSPAARVERRVFALQPSATGAEVQKALDEAAALTGSKPVVYLPVGKYRIAEPLIIPEGADLQMVGDGDNTTLVWEGKTGGTVLTVKGPTGVTLRDFSVTADGSANSGRPERGILFSGIDQEGGRIDLDQVSMDRCVSHGILIDGVGKTRIEFRGSGVSGTTEGIGLEVRGARSEGQPWIGFFGGAGSNNVLSYQVAGGGKLLIWDTWYEATSNDPDFKPRFVHLTDAGQLTYFNGKISTLAGPQAHRELFGVDLDGFRGEFALLGASFDNTNPQIRLAGSGEGLNFLGLGILFSPTEPQVENIAPKAQSGVLASLGLRPDGGKTLGGKPSDDFLLRMLVPARTVRPAESGPVPAGATDLQIHRVRVLGGVSAGLVFQTEKAL